MGEYLGEKQPHRASYPTMNEWTSPGCIQDASSFPVFKNQAEENIVRG
jgi:hypothetical protein